MITNTQLDAAMQAAGIVDNRTNLIAAFNQTGAAPSVGFTLALAAAVMLDESNGRNIWGHDSLEPPYKELALPPDLNGQPVTQDNYTTYKMRRNQGMQPQGCGPFQLTFAGYQIMAQAAGGCWQPYPNILTGVRILKGLCLDFGSAQGGLTAWNGSSVYAERVYASAQHIQERFNNG